MEDEGEGFSLYWKSSGLKTFSLEEGDGEFLYKRSSL